MEHTKDGLGTEPVFGLAGRLTAPGPPRDGAEMGPEQRLATATHIGVREMRRIWASAHPACKPCDGFGDNDDEGIDVSGATCFGKP